MADVIKGLKVRNSDGSYTNKISIGADAQNITLSNGETVQDRLDSLGTVFKLKGYVATVSALPTSNNEVGDVYYVQDKSVGYVWINDAETLRWEEFGATVDLTNYYTKSEINSKVKTITATGSSDTWYSTSYMNHYLNRASTSETVIGVWNGSWLYRKIIHFGTLAQGSALTADIGVSNLGYIVNWYGFGQQSGGFRCPIPYIYDNTQAINLWFNGSKLAVRNYNAPGDIDVWVTIEYTKTS